MKASLVLLLSSAVLAADTKFSDLQACVKRVFGPGAMDRIVTPNDPTYTDARIGESIQFEQFPALIAFAKDASEVAPLVLCAKRTGYNAVPRTGAHHFLGYSALNDSLVIDISHIDSVHISHDKSSARVGAGIRLGPLYATLASAGTDWHGGICPTVGISGFLGAGGFNMQMRHGGLGIDHVLAAQVVLADGRTVTASPLENPDLFWAIRGGGGGTFGIVVEWTLALTVFPRSAMMLLNWNEADTAAQVAARWLDWSPNTDPLLTTQLNVKHNMTQLIGWCYGCELARAQELLDASGLLGIGKPEVFVSGNCSSLNSRMVGFIVNECMPDQEVAKLAPLALNFPQQPFTPIPLDSSPVSPASPPSHSSPPAPSAPSPPTSHPSSHSSLPSPPPPPSHSSAPSAPSAASPPSPPSPSHPSPPSPNSSSSNGTDATYPPFAWNETLQDPSQPIAQPWPRMIRISKSFFLQKSRPVSPDQLANVIARLHTLDEASNAWGEWHSWNIAGNSSSAAFAWRDTAYAHLEFIVSGSPDPQTQEKYLAWAEDLESYFRPIVGPATYTGYMDGHISTPPLESYFGANVPRLSQIKRQYDPFNFFMNPQSIQPVLPE